jgi:hypothetical protein
LWFADCFLFLHSAVCLRVTSGRGPRNLMCAAPLFLSLFLVSRISLPKPNAIGTNTHIYLYMWPSWEKGKRVRAYCRTSLLTGELVCFVLERCWVQISVWRPPILTEVFRSCLHFQEANTRMVGILRNRTKSVLPRPFLFIIRLYIVWTTDRSIK